MTSISFPSLLDGTDPRHRVSHLLELLRQRAAGFEEQRAAERLPLNAPVKLSVQLGGAEAFTPLYDAWGLDLSMHGVGLIVEQPVPTQMKLHADFEALAGEPCRVPVRILYCHPLLSHTYQLGAVFVWVAD